MAAPSVLDRVASVSSTSDATTFVPSLPSGRQVGNCLLALVTIDGTPGVDIVGGEGWKECEPAANDGNVRHNLFIKHRAEGSAADSLTIQVDSAQQFSAIVYAIDAGDFPAIEMAMANGSSSNSNPPQAFTFRGAKECLLLATRGGDGTVVPTVAPSGYSNLLNQAGGGTSGVSTSVAERTATVASEDPGSFTAGSEQWGCYTIMVWRDDGTRWDNLDRGDGVYLDDDNLTTGIGAGRWEQGVRGTIGHKSGKRGYRIDFGITTWASVGFGDEWNNLWATAEPGGIKAVYYDNDIDQVGGFAAGGDGEWVEGGEAGSWLPEEGDNCVLLIDFDALKFWVGKNGGDWNFNPSANPDAGTGGLALPSFFEGAYLYPIFYGDNVSDVHATFDSTALVGYSNCSTFNYWDYVAAAGYNLTAAVGSFAISGNSAALKSARKIAAAAGSFSASVLDAALRYGQRLAANFGAFAVTGNAATIRAARRLAAGQGSVIFTGRTAALKFARRLAAAAGAFAVTGLEATLNVVSLGHRLAADAGSFAVTGIVASLKASRKLVAARGTFVLAGYAAATRASRRLVAARGAYAVAGIAAVVKIGRRLVAAAGTFALAGFAVTLQRGKVLVAAAGYFLVAAMSAALRRAALLQADAGQITATGRDVGLVYEHPLRWDPIPESLETWVDQSSDDTIWTNQGPGASPWSAA